ncbi:hypothetical protein GJ744_006835 [Endocarpon pusillum]|uniref:SnoaL-like domain-containing protein n=1 Tax=Endocarpon pusillum TaxID=364733 RepID=A0A8H7E4M3_9EURO|nr:hypothetical protein GJ744_006835 [Endocarpon pusillum]
MALSQATANADTSSWSSLQANPTLMSNVRINMLSASTTAWLTSVLTALDAKDLSAYTSFMAPQVSLQFNNSPAIVGIDAARSFLSQYWTTFGSLRHEELNVYGTETNLVHEALNHYTGLDGRKVTVRAVAWIDRDEEGRIEGLRVYADLSKLWSQEGQEEAD